MYNVKLYNKISKVGLDDLDPAKYKNWNKIINIKGGDIMVSDVRKMEAENKTVNIHACRL